MNAALDPAPRDRMAGARRRPPAPALQLAVLVAAVLAAALAAHGATVVGGSPIWILALLAGVWIIFPALLLTAIWRVHTALGTKPGRVLGPLELGAAAAFGAALVLLADGSPFARLPAAIGAAAGLAALLTHLRARRRRTRRLDLRTRGLEGEAVITDDGLARFRRTPSPKLTRITVEYGERVLTLPAHQDPARPLAVGDRVRLWVDPGDPERWTAVADNGASRLLDR
ncbi:hypothetical protein AB0H71_22610 [Nocardia sp. NPDC050697]|uniref:hypothetical protein n=1 Tax=Nocardia sp. NPDC050697 TaxID=3155158 RepID=UPI0033F72A86